MGPINTFNQDKLQQFYDARDYDGAAKYLETCPAPSYRAQQQVNETIRQLKRAAAIQQSTYNSLSNNDQDAYKFMQALNGEGVIPRTVNVGGKNYYNHYGKTYTDNLNNLKTNDNVNIGKLGIETDDDNLKLLTSALGIDDIRNNDIGITYSKTQNGRHRLIFDKNNTNLYKILKATDDISTRSGWDIFDNIGAKSSIGGIGGGTIGSAIGGLAGGIGAVPGAAIGGVIGMVVGAVGGIVDEIGNAIENNNRFVPFAVDDNNKIRNIDEFNYDNIEKIMAVANEANDIYTKANEQQEKKADESVTVETVVTPFLGAGHAEAHKAYTQGKMNQATYDAVTKNWNDAYDRLITGADFTQHPVYAWSLDSKEGRVLTKQDNKDVPDLQAEVLAAMKEGRLEKQLCINNGEIGTLLTITPKNDSKSDDWSEKKGEIYKQVFIQGLYEGSAEQAFEADTKTKAARQNADMKRWNYEQELSTGVIVGYSDGTPYVKTVQAGTRPTKTPISEEQMIESLNESAILEGSVLEVLGRAEHDNMDRKEIEQKLKILSTAATNELRPKAVATDNERILYEADMYRHMLMLFNKYYNLHQNNN